MCRSVAEGGQRCAAHTRPAYTAALRAVVDEEPGAAERLMKASVEYASTREGRAMFVTDLELAVEEKDWEQVAEIEAILTWGDAMKAANDEARRQIAAVDRPREFPVMRKDGTLTSLHAGVFDEDARALLAGEQSFALAAAISRETGWPMVVRESRHPQTGRPVCHHAWVRTPRGTFIDAEGELDYHPDTTMPVRDEDTGELFTHREVPRTQIVPALQAYLASGLPGQETRAAQSFVPTILGLYRNPAARHRTVSWRWAETA